MTPDWGIGCPDLIGGGLITLCADYGATPVAGFAMGGGGYTALGGANVFIAPVDGGCCLESGAITG